MTNNTIPNVPRELLLAKFENWHNKSYGPQGEFNPVRSLDRWPENTGLGYQDSTVQAQFFAFCGALELSAPSPAGVDGLHALTGEYHADCSALMAIIDGLRGENERIRLNIAEYNEAISCYQSERDQQAQRIGELEGLLRAESARVDFLDAYIVTADAPDTGKAAMLADSGTLRECIDAALSAGKEGE